MIVSLALSAVLALPGAPAHAWHSWAPDGVKAFSNTVLVRNNVFTSHGTQEIWADSRNRFGVYTKQPAGNTAVLSYPDRQDLEYIPIHRLRALRANYKVNMPSRGDYETAFDIWVQPNGDPNDWDHNIEVMIWVNNHGQVPAGRPMDHAVTEYDQRFTIWRDGPKNQGDSIFSLVLNDPRKHGTMHILSVFRWLIAHGYFPASSGLNDVEFGWEICSTGGAWENFRARYSLHRELS